MTPTQPTGLWHFLSRKRLVVPKHLAHFFYTSWEDALWDLLLFFHIHDGAIALVPEYFCADVLVNMKSHGVRHVFYPVDEQLQTDPDVFSEYLKKYKPSVVVIFHAVGMTNTLFVHSEKWLDQLPPETLLIEDAVHRLLDPADITLLTKRHVVIDSLRKVVPLFGSNLYGDANTLHELKQTSWSRTALYQLLVFFWWVVFQSNLLLATIPLTQSWQTFWNLQAEQAMNRGYDIIGDSHEAGMGWWPFSYLALHLNLSKIKRIKRQQVLEYTRVLDLNRGNPLLVPVQIPQQDEGELVGYPIVLRLPNAQRILSELQTRGVQVHFSLDDCPWAQRQKIFYLPLGPHLSTKNVQFVATALDEILRSFDTKT